MANANSAASRSWGDGMDELFICFYMRNQRRDSMELFLKIFKAGPRLPRGVIFRCGQKPRINGVKQGAGSCLHRRGGKSAEVFRPAISVSFPALRCHRVFPLVAAPARNSTVSQARA